MGKNKDKKKKGHGMEKTLAKTEKKIQKNIKKELEEIGEDEIEKIIASINEKEKQLQQVKEEVLPNGQFPPRRGGATFSLFPEKEELVLFGGEYFDGSKAFVYNDLFIYSIKKNEWTKIKAPNAPPPRTFHQSILISRNGGELWVFGGEFQSVSQSQFYHYNDLHVFNFQTKKWNKIVSPNAPSPRSGHRMALLKKYLIIFGGYYDNLRNCKFYNDTHLFNLETNQWEQMKYSTTGLIDIPSPRSACHFITSNKNNNLIVYGGFSKEKLKKDKEKGIVHSDMFVLSNEESQVKKNDSIEWTWKKVKQTGLRPSERISSSMITINDDTAILFGGVFDNDNLDDMEDDEEVEGPRFYNDLYKLDLNSYKWSQVNLRGKRELAQKKTLKVNDASEINTNKSDQEMEDLEESSMSLNHNDINIDQLQIEMKEENEKIKDSDVFQLSYSEVPRTSNENNEDTINNKNQVKDILKPSCRRSSYIQFYKSNLFVYGGKFEDNEDNEITFNDMYYLNVKKMEEWITLYEDKDLKLEKIKNASMSSDEENKEEDDESDIEINAPELKPNENVDDYFNRTTDLWIEEVSKEFPDEKSSKVLRKMAFELCTMFWKNLSS